MSDSPLHLSPDFCLTLRAGRKILFFPQLPEEFQRGNIMRLRLIDTLNKGFADGREELVNFIHRETKTPKNGINIFLNELESGGFLLEGPPEVLTANESAGTPRDVGDAEVILVAPLSFVPQGGYYCLFDHDGELQLRLAQAELLALIEFREAITVAQAKHNYFEQDRKHGLTSEQFDSLVTRIAGAELLRDPAVLGDDTETDLFGTVDRNELQRLIDKRVAAHDEQVAKEGKNLVPVVPVNTVHGTTPASLGLVVAYAMEYEGGKLKDRYDFVPMFMTDLARLSERAKKPGVYLFSNYLWNTADNLALSEAVKIANPANITIHGGPNTPAYVQECEEFFAKETHVDITVRSEGEATLADILDKLQLPESTDLEVLRDVPGLTFRTATGVHRTDNRERIADLDSIPSPYLMGLFEEFGNLRASAVIETNRGCPYGCTFCDWGSATLSKVRRFDLDRVFAELEWSSSHRVEDASIADANFGMLERDIDVTNKIAELRKQYGFPNTVGMSYAKNQVRYLRDIIRILAEVGILTEGKVSLQTMDKDTLATINRDNIKTSKYNELGQEFREARLPLGAELMLGLPGSTLEGFRNDLQDCTNRDVRVQSNPTMILPNSPMNDPDYRKEHGILARAGEYIYETATFTREDWDHMMKLRSAYALLDTYGIARYVARYVRGETGMREIDFYDKLQQKVLNNQKEWPVLAGILREMEDFMAPPGSWSFLIRELKRYTVEELGLPDNAGLRTALAVQLAHLPATDRKFPHVIELEHDFTAWWTAILEARENDHREDWEEHVPRLSSYGPATLTITDPNKICILEVGKSLTALGYNLRTWELDSPVARARTAMAARQ